MRFLFFIKEEMAHRHGKIIQFGAASEINAGKYKRMTVIPDKYVKIFLFRQ